MSDLVRREDVLEITSNLRGQDLGGANWIVDDIADMIRALPSATDQAGCDNCGFRVTWDKQGEKVTERIPCSRCTSARDPRAEAAIRAEERERCARIVESRLNVNRKMAKRANELGGPGDPRPWAEIRAEECDVLLRKIRSAEG